MIGTVGPARGPASKGDEGATDSGDGPLELGILSPTGMASISESIALFLISEVTIGGKAGSIPPDRADPLAPWHAPP